MEVKIPENIENILESNIKKLNLGNLDASDIEELKEVMDRLKIFKWQEIIIDNESI